MKKSRAKVLCAALIAAIMLFFLSGCVKTAPPTGTSVIPGVCCYCNGTGIDAYGERCQFCHGTGIVKYYL